MPTIIHSRNVAIKGIGSTVFRRSQTQKHTSDFNAFINGPYEPPPSPARKGGIPIAIKDNICTTGMPTTCASRILNGFSSPFDATVVEKLKEHGHSISGKTNMDEFGMGSHSTNSYYGPVKTKGKDGQLNMSAGGSSGGSAVATAELLGRSWAALGTDTGGSVRLPAAYTSQMGFKPSYGMVSRWGVVAYANSLDTVGILTRASKITSIFDAIKRFDPKDPTSLPESTRERIEALYTILKEDISKPGPETSASVTKVYRVGVPLEYNVAELSPEVREAWEITLDCFQRAGHEIIPVSLPTTEHALSAYYVLAPAEASSNLAKYDGVRYGARSEGSDGSNGVLFSKTRGQGFGDEVKRRVLLGSYTLSADALDNYFIQAQKVRRLVQEDFDRVFRCPNPLRENDLSKPWSQEGVDILIVPTAPTLPPSLDHISKQSPVQAYMNDVFTVPASLAGLPAISVPFAQLMKDPDRPAIGIQIIAQFGMDDFVLYMAEKAYRYCKKHLDTSFQNVPLDKAKVTIPGKAESPAIAKSNQKSPEESHLGKDTQVKLTQATKGTDQPIAPIPGKVMDGAPGLKKPFLQRGQTESEPEPTNPLTDPMLLQVRSYESKAKEESAKRTVLRPGKLTIPYGTAITRIPPKLPVLSIIGQKSSAATTAPQSRALQSQATWITDQDVKNTSLYPHQELQKVGADSKPEFVEPWKALQMRRRATSASPIQSVAITKFLSRDATNPSDVSVLTAQKRYLREKSLAAGEEIEDSPLIVKYTTEGAYEDLTPRTGSLEKVPIRKLEVDPSSTSYSTDVALAKMQKRYSAIAAKKESERTRVVNESFNLSPMLESINSVTDRTAKKSYYDPARPNLPLIKTYDPTVIPSTPPIRKRRSPDLPNEADERQLARSKLDQILLERHKQESVDLDILATSNSQDMPKQPSRRVRRKSMRAYLYKQVAMNYTTPLRKIAPGNPIIRTVSLVKIKTHYVQPSRLTHPPSSNAGKSKKKAAYRTHMSKRRKTKTRGRHGKGPALSIRTHLSRLIPRREVTSRRIFPRRVSPLKIRTYLAHLIPSVEVISRRILSRKVSPLKIRTYGSKKIGTRSTLSSRRKRARRRGKRAIRASSSIDNSPWITDKSILNAPLRSHMSSSLSVRYALYGSNKHFPLSARSRLMRRSIGELRADIKTQLQEKKRNKEHSDKDPGVAKNIYALTRRQRMAKKFELTWLRRKGSAVRFYRARTSVDAESEKLNKELEEALRNHSQQSASIWDGKKGLVGKENATWWEADTSGFKLG